MSYQERSDLNLSEELFRLAGPDGETFKAFHHDAIARTDGQIPNKYRELVALGVAFTTQCPLCVDLHTAGAKRHGASREEIAEVCMIAAAMRAGAAYGQGLLALKLYDAR
ncbi:carboxymuconolactone decarboxylase family protein [Paraburkholderia phymatum]|uniref:Carboxymuconolactone decarboxylase family protein n=1 Tax=Paraburkholderia phymatum TaxID=148447 RepID=A0ACC6UDB9_9BURK